MKRSFTALGLVAALTFAGCPTDPSANYAPVTETHDDHGHSDHDHASEGPHHGKLVQLGNEEFHAEIVHEGDDVTIYILDSSAKKTVPIEAETLILNFVVSGEPKQFTLASQPLEADGEGKSSRFQLTDAELAKVVDSKETRGRMNVSIDGKAYTGRLDEDHSHDH